MAEERKTQFELVTFRDMMGLIKGYRYKPKCFKFKQLNFF